MSGLSLRPKETLLGILPAPTNLYARFASTDDSTPRYFPLIAVAIIRGMYGELDAIHRLDGFLDAGHALASDLPDFDGFEFVGVASSPQTPWQSSESDTKAAVSIPWDIARRLVFLVKIGAEFRMLNPDHAALLLEALGESNPVKTEGME